MATLGIYLMGAALLVVAGVLKTVAPADTARAFAAALPRTRPRMWPPLVRSLAAAEAALGAVAIVWPGRVPATLVAVSYLAFTAWVLWARAHGGVLSTCGCFGTPDTPPTALHAAINALVAAGAIGVVISAPSGTIASVLSGQYLDGVPLVAASLLSGWLAYLVMAPLARLGALRAAQPYIPGGRP
jgi:hypothetical protein